ncbi:MAG: hypothetical protein WC829_01985 [Hyphomicrobium sp.]|jgi:hypothetical protein
MARGTTLLKLLEMYRGECRLSLNVAHNTQQRDQQIAHIQRTQEWLWEDFDWPLLRVERKITLQAGQYLYNPPSDMKIDRIQKIEVYESNAYIPLCAGIDAEHYTSHSTELDERDWPVRRWRINESEQIEVWPIPDADGSAVTFDGTLKLTGIKNLPALIEDTDTAALDDRLIILFCASEVLQSTGAKDAADKRNMANARYMKLRGHQTPRKKFTMFGVGQDESRAPRPPIAVYNSTV